MLKRIVSAIADYTIGTAIVLFHLSLAERPVSEVSGTDHG
jgi:hypothetical protein